MDFSTTTSVELRRILPAERWILDAVFSGLSSSSRALRYLVPLVRLTASMEAALMDLEEGRHVAWVAFDAGRPVGIGRYVRTGDSRAELAVEVVDDAQGRGIGSALTASVTQSAAEAGLAEVEVVVHPENVRVLRALRDRGVSLVLEQGMVTGRVAVVDDLRRAG